MLETHWETSEGRVRVLEFMPLRREAASIVRIVEGLSGRVTISSELAIRFGYGRVVPLVNRRDDALVATAGAEALVFRTAAPTRGESTTLVSTVEVQSGERVPFTLTWVPSHAEVPVAIDAEQALRETEAFCGGIVAAPTTSLPEWPGGERNWDYRYCWLRDATMTLLALIDAGYVEEASEWRAWLLRAAAGDPADIQIMYGVAGERRLPEWVVDWLPGFEGARPVRVGNAAAQQDQLDVYGEVTDALYQARKRNVGASLPAWELGRQVLELLEQRWRQPDEGIWRCAKSGGISRTRR